MFRKFNWLIYGILEQWMEGHCKSMVTGLFFLAVTSLDADKETVILCMGISNTLLQENRVNWLRFSKRKKL